MAVFGKNILENLTTGMYPDARVLYREYVQNSCDAIDSAVDSGIIAREDTSIDIYINAEKQEIHIRDNGSGICKEDFVRVLSDIANSDKKRAVDKGFRGIGRLCGLAYCNEMRFISSAKGELKASVMTWNARKMRTMLNDDRKHTADEVLGAILDTSYQSANMEEHFFEVIMTGVTNPDLLNKDIIRNYLSFEIPVPYPNKFMFNEQIYEHAKQLGVSIDEYNVFVGDESDEQVFKGYSTRIYSGNKVHDEIKAIEFNDFYDENDKLIAWMWFGLSSLNGQIKAQGNIQRGLRLRKGNIQIGESGTLRRLFKDARGNEYFIGEVFAIHSELIPNARRDYFNENTICDEFERQLREFFDYLWKLCNVASDERSAYKSIKDYRESVTKFKEKIKTGFSGGVDRETMQNALEEKRQRAEKAQRTLRKSTETTDDDITVRVKSIVRTVEITGVPEPLKPLPEIPSEVKKSENGKKSKPIYITDELSQYTKETRRVVGRIYDLINQNAPNIAQELITKIHAGLKLKRD